MCSLSKIRLPYFEHRCSADVFIAVRYGDNCSWLKQPYINLNVLENMLPLGRSSPPVERLDSCCRRCVLWVDHRGCKAWIIDAVYECMFSIWPLGLQRKLQQASLGAEGKAGEWERQRDRWSSSREAMGHLVPRDPPSAISDMFNQGLQCYTQKNTHFPAAADTEQRCFYTDSTVGRQCSIYATVSSIMKAALY